MQTTAQRVLKAYLWFIALFHLFVGLSINLSDRFTRMIAAGYGATVEWTPQFVYMLRPLGAFMIILGLLAALAARQPARYPAVVLGFIVLFAIRALQRFVYADVLASAFGISPARNTFNMLLFVAQAVLLLVVWRMARRAEHAAGAAMA